MKTIATLSVIIFALAFFVHYYYIIWPCRTKVQKFVVVLNSILGFLGIGGIVIVQGLRYINLEIKTVDDHVAMLVFGVVYFIVFGLLIFTLPKALKIKLL